MFSSIHCLFISIVVLMFYWNTSPNQDNTYMRWIWNGLTGVYFVPFVEATASLRLGPHWVWYSLFWYILADSLVRALQCMCLLATLPCGTTLDDALCGGHQSSLLLPPSRRFSTKGRGTGVPGGRRSGIMISSNNNSSRRCMKSREHCWGSTAAMGPQPGS